MESISSIRSSLYASLAHCFQGPRAEFLRPGRDNPLLAALQDLAGEGSLAVLKGEARELLDVLEGQPHRPAEELRSTLEVEHARLFLGPGPVLASPYESVYLDPQGLVMGIWAAQALQRYAEEGLALSPSFRDCPDHIGAELEFMAYLCWREAEAQEEWRLSKLVECRRRQLSFLQGHLLQWVPAFCRRLLSTSPSPWYSCLASVLREVIYWDTERLVKSLSRRAQEQETPQHPSTSSGQCQVPRQIQIDAGACTFCEACVAMCPLNAFRLSRQPSEALLLLLPARCNLCGICERVCPEAAIHICDSPSPSGEEARVLARSPILLCRRCQKPLEAQGLLDKTLLKLKEGVESQRLEEAVALCPGCRYEGLALALSSGQIQAEVKMTKMTMKEAAPD